MRRGRCLALVLLAACAGREGPIAAPSARARVHVVGCAPAARPPLISSAGLDVDPLGTARELARFRVRARGGHEPSTRAPAVELEPVVVINGSLDSATVTRELRSIAPAIERCLARQSDALRAALTLTMSLVVEPDGVLMVERLAGGAGPQVWQCVQNAISAQRLPAAGAATRISLRLKLDPVGLAPAPAAQATEPRRTEPWTPYAIELAEPLDSAPQFARNLEAALRRKAGALDACFSHSNATGSLRAMIELDTHGRVAGARIGGLGERAVESCVRDAIAELVVATPSADTAELACDLSHGDASPWRVAPEAGYQVIDAAPTAITYGGTTLAPDGDTEPLSGGATYLILVDPATSGAQLDRALTWAHDGDATLVALRTPAGPPVVIGVGRSIYSVVDDDEPEATSLTIVVGRSELTACERTPRARGVTSATSDAALSDPRAVSALLGELAARCRETSCTGTLGVAVDKAAVVRDLVEVLSAARIHGFDRVMIGSGSCTATREDEEL